MYASPKITIPSGKLYNLGALDEGRVYKRSFFVGNTGDSPLEIKVVKVGCGCTTITYPKSKVTILPNQAMEVQFTFNTEGMEGETEKYIYIESNDSQEPLLRLKLIAEVKRSHLASIKRFLSFGLFTVLGAGLIDGINPCAFTVLIFFISFLNFVGYRKRELVILGSIFIFSVFVTYCLIGLGLFKIIQSLAAFSMVSKLAAMLIASLAIVLGFYSIYDWYIYRKTGNPDDVKLRLPDFLKQRIHTIVQNSSRNKNRTLFELAGAVFISGFLVSLLESVCTGQTYLPTIAYVFKTTSLRPLAGVYLILYNLMFILPLTIIFIAALKGVSSEAFSKIARKHLGAVKLLTAALFFLLGILLFWAKGGL